MRTVIVGNRKLARQLLLHTLREGWAVVGALVPGGRLATEQANFEPVEDVVKGTDCQLYQTDDINAEETIRWLQGLSPEVCLCGGWSQIIDERVLTIPDRGFLGLHSSRLPEGRGGAPVNWSIINGNERVWISLFCYVSGVDAGDVLAQGSVPVEDRDDAGTVFDRLAVEACRLVESVRNELEEDVADPEPQSLADATYRPRRQPQDGLIDWERSPSAQYDWIRAQTNPYPGAYTFWNGARLTIWRAKPLETDPGGVPPGTVLGVSEGNGIDVRTGDGVLRLTRVQQGNRPPRWADEYAAAVGPSAGDRLGIENAPDDWLYTGIRGPSESTAFETSLVHGESGAVDLVMFSGSTHDVTVRVTLDQEALFERTAMVTAPFRERVPYAPEAVGTHSLTAAFERDGKRIDTRYLKVFVHNGR